MVKSSIIHLLKDDKVDRGSATYLLIGIREYLDVSIYITGEEDELISG